MSRIVRISRWPLVTIVIALLGILGYRIMVIDEEAEAAILPMALLLYAPTEHDVLGALHRAGLDAEALAAAGVSEAEAEELAADVIAHLTANPTALSTADATYGEARTAHSQLEQTICSGLASQQDITDYTSACTDLASAAAARDSAVDAVFNAGTADIADQDVINVLQTIRANRDLSWRSMPVEFLTIERSESDWLALRNALAEERIVAAGGEGAGPNGALSSASESLLTTARSQATVSAAVSNLATNLALIEAALNDAAAGQGS